MKLILKLIQSIAFAFDKKGTKSGYINLICCFFSLIIVYNRNIRAIVIEESAFIATNIYDSLLLWLFLFVGIQKLSNEQINVTTLALFFAISIFLSLLPPIYQTYSKNKLLTNTDATCLVKLEQSKLELYLFRLF